MKKRMKIAGGIATGTIAILSGMLLVIAGTSNETDDTDFSALESEQVEMTEYETDVQENESVEYKILNVSLHPAGSGQVSWYLKDDLDDREFAHYTISPEKDIEFIDAENHPLPENDDFMEKMEAAVISKLEELDDRAVHFLQGAMNEELTKGNTIFHAGFEKTGEIRFTVRENGEIVANEDDWNALPETDENTLDDFHHTVEEMISNWGIYYRHANE